MSLRTFGHQLGGSSPSSKLRENRKGRLLARATSVVCEALESRWLLSTVVYQDDFEDSTTSDRHGSLSGSIIPLPSDSLQHMLNLDTTHTLTLSGLGKRSYGLSVSATLILAGDINPTIGQDPRVLPLVQTTTIFEGGPQWTVKLGSDELFMADFALDEPAYGGGAYGGPGDLHVLESSVNEGAGFDWHSGTDPEFNPPGVDCGGTGDGASYNVSFDVVVKDKETVTITFEEGTSSGYAKFGLDNVTVTEYEYSACSTCGKNPDNGVEQITPGIMGAATGGAALINTSADIGAGNGAANIPALYWLGPDEEPEINDHNWTSDSWVGKSLVAIYTLDSEVPVWFDASIYPSPTFTAKDGYKGKLELDEAHGWLVLTDEEGGLTYYADDSAGIATGRFIKYVDPDDNTWASDTSSGPIASVSQSGGAEEAVDYSYDGTSGQLTGVSIHRGGGGAVRSAAYDYYGSSEDFGNLGNLKFATISNDSGQSDVYYYRYWKVGDDGYDDANAWPGAPKFIFSPKAYARLAAAAAAMSQTTTTIDDDHAKAYADTYYEEFDADRRVTKEVIAGQGELQISTSLRSSNTNLANVDDGYNVWKYRTDTSYGDGTHSIVFKNYLGDTMLELFKDHLGNERPVMYYRYGTATSNLEQLVMTAHPSAFTLHSGKYYNVDAADLLSFSGNYSDYLADDKGLIELTQYYDSTTASGTNAGGVAGYFKQSLIERGDHGDAIRQRKVDYFSHTSGSNAGSATIYPIAHETVFAGTGADGSEFGTAPRTTTYQYYFTGDGTTGTITDDTNHMVWRKTMLPLITYQQNGPAANSTDYGSADTVTEYFDNFGRVTWSKDGTGSINLTEYDEDTGAALKRIVDVDYASLSSPEKSDYPSGWDTNHAGVHLVTAYVVDTQGRLTKITEANGNVTYMVYDDAKQETRTYRGFDGTNTTGPIEISREDRAGSYTEQLTLAITPHLNISGVPDGSETFTGTNIRSLVRTHMNDQGQVDESDRYFFLGTELYATGTASFHIGSAGTNYSKTTFGYDATGRQNRVVNPLLTITRTVYDDLGRVASTWVGTDDAPASGTWSPANTTDTNLTKVSENLYDTYDTSSPVVGDSNLTRTLGFANGTASAQVTDMYYDWRDRQVASKSGVYLDPSSGLADPGSEGTNVQRILLYTTYDNLNEATQQDQYDGDGLGMLTSNAPTDGNSDGVPDAPSGSGTNALRARVITNFDDQGRVWLNEVHKIDQSSGATNSTALRTWTWYDHRGSVVKTFAPGGLATKYAYDGAGRIKAEYLTDSGGDTIGATNGGAWWNALDVAGDNVLQQKDYTYDKNGNVILLTTRQHLHDDTNKGALGDVNGTPKARVSFQTFQYDAANRQTAAVDYGTNAAVPITSVSTVLPGRTVATGTATSTGTTTTLVDTGRTEATDYWIGATIRFTSGALNGKTATVTGFSHGTGTITYSPATTSAPASGVNYRLMPNAMVTEYSYDDAGRLASVTDPRGIVNKTYYDTAGRTTKTIANYVDGVAAGAADDQTTEYTYDDNDNILTMVAVLNNSGGTNNASQTTQYWYGVTNGAGVADSLLTSNDLLRKIQYPDKTTGSPGSGTTYAEVLAYDALGQKKSFTDRNATVHQYSYDALGRLLTDNVTTLGSGVDGTIRRIDYSYDTAGRQYQVTNFGNTNGTGTPLNQIQYSYNGYGQLTAEYQEHSGSVSTGSSPVVQYVYSEGGTQKMDTDSAIVSDDNSRLMKMIYPNGRTVRYEYGTSGGLNDRISRLAFLADDAGGTIGNHIEDYLYLGLDTVVSRDRPSGNSELTYIKDSTDTVPGDAGDQYKGLDRFGRIADQRWIGQSGSATTTLDRFQYQYDADSNPLSKDNKVSSSFSELYHTNGTSGASTQYDGLNRLTDFRRGALSDANSDGTLDTVGFTNSLTGSVKNWSLDAVGNWNSSTSGVTTTTRTHDLQNAVTSVGANSLAFDFNGNTITDETGKHLVYDAWNRLKLVKNSANTTTLQTYAYDPAGHRSSENSGTATELYYSNQWQVLEERQSGLAKSQYVWSPTYVDELIERDRDVDGSVDGAIETSFGSFGKTTTDFAGNDDEARAVAIQKDGMAVVAGYAKTVSGDYDFAVARYKSDGSLDTTFGSSGKVTVDFTGTADYAYAVTIQNDGKIILAGQAGLDFGIARLNADGSLDTSFDTDGKVTVDFSGTDYAQAVKIQSDGKIVVGGYTFASSHNKFAVARLTSSGALDTTFDSDGKATLYDVAHSLDDVGYAMDLQNDGKIIVGGQSSGDLALGRFNTDGSADTAFDSDGIVTSDLGGTEEIRGLIAQSDGTIVVGGTKGTDFVIARFTGAGVLDTTFGASSGYTSTDFSLSTDAAYSIARQADGKFVAAGISGGNFALARFTTSGALDTTFNSTGKLTTDFGSSVDTAYGIAIGPNYKITAVGYTGAYPNGNFAVSRYTVTSGLEERIYAQTDANHNVTSISDVFGSVLERFVYDPYGSVTVENAFFSTTTSDTKSWKYMHQGGRYDSVAGLYTFRHRDYSPTLGRWMGQDASGYMDGADLYEYVKDRPTSGTDATGEIGIFFAGAKVNPFADGAKHRSKSGMGKLARNPAVIAELKKVYLKNATGSIDSAVRTLQRAVRQDPHQKVVLAGHSWGAATALEVADAVKDCISIDLVITVDPVNGPNSLPRNVRYGLNLFVSGGTEYVFGRIGGNQIQGSTNIPFTGKSSNGQKIDHENIDDIPESQSLMVEAITGNTSGTDPIGVPVGLYNIPYNPNRGPRLGPEY